MIIVINETLGVALVLLLNDNSLWKGVPEGGILLHDSKEVTGFPLRKAARAAIKRTKAYFNRHASRDRDEYTLRALVPSPTA